MGIYATAVLTCDKCETEVNAELKKDQSPEDAVDSEGWFITGLLLDRLLCADCYEEEEGDG